VEASAAVRTEDILQEYRAVLEGLAAVRVAIMIMQEHFLAVQVL
jgi:hypothetical protein